MYDYLIIGAGFSGCVLAERLVSQLGKSVLIIDKRNHIGGNSYDCYSDAGILIHPYGPHYFRTNDNRIIEYLSQFTEWIPQQYEIRAHVDGKLLPFPINLDTVNQLYGWNLTEEQLITHFEAVRIPKGVIRNSEDLIISRIGIDLYEKFYKNYTKKQWGLFPSELDPSVCGRIPFRTNHDRRYLLEQFQCLPKDGYTKMFERMIYRPGVEIMLNTDYRSAIQNIKFDRLIYTGPIDEFFNYMHGKLPYRSLRFEFETLNQEFFQGFSQVNYPNEEEFTRIIEIKHVTKQKSPKTTIAREYPLGEGEPYYPVPTDSNRALYQRYKEEAEKLRSVYFTGRLACYQYFNMDQVVAQALRLFETKLGETSVSTHV